MVELQPVFKKAYWSLAIAGLIYVSIIFSLTFPTIQRFALYAHMLNPTIWENVNDVENFGFLRTQVQPFNLTTPDGETIYAWHMLPIHLCREHEELLNANEPFGPAEDVTQTAAFKLLAEDPNARVVVSFHGNAGHIGFELRSDGYRMGLGISTPQNPVHVFAIDYRGFGLSTGFPTEEGVITDAVTLLNFLTSPPLNIPPSRIVIIGQSLGTAVTAAVAERFAFGSPDPNAIQPAIKDPEPFAGIILLASFSNIPKLIESYSLKGLTPPMLSPLVGYPPAQKYALDHIVDRWDTASRLARLTGIAQNESDSAYVDKELDLAIIHARDDYEIPWREGRRNWIAATGEGLQDAPGDIVYQRTAEDGRTEIKIWERPVSGSSKGTGKKKVKRVRWERVGYGGHNRIATYSVASLAILRAFEE
ncbi:hypothetical protein DTO027B5_8082 [Paecilomyces variotii]|nr:hypothetical protein DTO169C6_4369 [Paecilomyces variotii]KAJ9320044.1 hypothetical protein DTO027B3_8922 [Paecilomyces variotii]KAJ9330188.1 hypothetical protein DTO027B5_8082 [Paecilomyces variotii]